MKVEIWSEMGSGQAEASTRRVEALAESEGLSPYRILDNTVGNTHLAHEFLAHASAEGRTGRRGRRSSAPTSAGPSPSSRWRTC